MYFFCATFEKKVFFKVFYIRQDRYYDKHIN